MDYIVWFSLFISMILLINGYFKLADKYNIIDKPNQRSSHTSITLRGGGIIFPIALILWFIYSGFKFPYLVLGVVLIATISFLDDILTLSTKPRLLVHLLSVLLVLYQLDFIAFPWWFWILAIILIIGWLNTFNFMDGINGITVLYSGSVLIPLALLNVEANLVDQDLYYILGLGLAVFGFYNLRKKAKTFAGDVGSISMGLIIAFLLIGIIVYSGRWEYIVMVSIYGIDSVLTIIQRLLKKENIFEAHRSHLYQWLANELKVPHVAVSAIYAFIQLNISMGLLFVPEEMMTFYASCTLFILSILYIMVKFRLARKIAS